jgi:hypothetical protein
MPRSATFASHTASALLPASHQYLFVRSRYQRVEADNCVTHFRIAGNRGHHTGRLCLRTDQQDAHPRLRVVRTATHQIHRIGKVRQQAATQSGYERDVKRLSWEGDARDEQNQREYAEQFARCQQYPSELFESTAQHAHVGGVLGCQQGNPGANHAESKNDTYPSVFGHSHIRAQDHCQHCAADNGKTLGDT